MGLIPAILGLAGTAWSAIASKQASDQQAATAQNQVNAQEAAIQSQDQQLADQETKNRDRQVQDAQWMQMKAMAAGAAGATTQAPSALLSLQTKNLGSTAAATAGRLK